MLLMIRSGDHVMLLPIFMNGEEGGDDDDDDDDELFFGTVNVVSDLLIVNFSCIN
jgi:hypothetical protein